MLVSQKAYEHSYVLFRKYTFYYILAYYVASNMASFQTQTRHVSSPGDTRLKASIQTSHIFLLKSTLINFFDLL